MRRFFSQRQRLILRLLAGNRCRRCGKPLTDRFHADHKQAFTKGGPTTLHNGQALCPPCNNQKGAKE
ncbi:HNH endonuclease [Microvirga mediterraneensis]|uniref:HNH endonuclease n=1 Tax=Microvirga mediterraneensis TaxID=2754695 RepID=A0A838BTZ7_9HYPH|nr:HNH endonuclease signature motif containing protein [Microvirga mediterraneensis]MBA1159017.1 HNH endonuclease [Microvirga mediterraneensis]